ncbi:MAG: DUF892 family protein [Porphyrobacter sp.]|nr:DUF892 family protein [Porphyrobacter sp.]
MAKTRTANELLIVALQDLNDAERAMVERLPSLQSNLSPGLGKFVGEELTRAEEQRRRLDQWLTILDAPATDAPNIWLRAVIDDATRDYETIEPGVLRDIALVGAFRKGIQAERVSYETALGLARSTGKPDLEGSLRICRDEEAAADLDLATLLDSLLTDLQRNYGSLAPD